MANGWGNNGNSERLYFLGFQNHCRWWLQPWNYKTLLGRKAMTNIDSTLENRDIPLPTKVRTVKAVVFPVVMCGYESWIIKLSTEELCFWAVVLEKTWESLDSKEIKPVYPKGNQSWIFIGRTDAEAETPTLGPPDVKNWLIGIDPDAGKDWSQEEKGTTADEMVGWC